jgi:hypothetical protein
MRPGITIKSVIPRTPECQLEGLVESRFIVSNAEQILVWNDDQRINVLLKLSNASVGHAHAARSFKLEGAGDNSNRQNALLFSRARDNGCCTRACTTAHASGDEDHIGILEMIENFALAFFCRCHAHLRGRACTQALGGVQADLNAALSFRARQGLCIRVRHYKLNALQVSVDHVVNGIAPCPTNAEYDDAWAKFCSCGDVKTDSHTRLLEDWGR